jgi:hypothetical protein
MTKRSDAPQVDSEEVAPPQYVNGEIVQQQGDHVIVRDEAGKWKPGASPARGAFDRSLGKSQRKYLKALELAVPPEEVPALILETIVMARSEKQPKVLLDVIKLALSYQVGLPRRSVSVDTTNMNDLYRMLVGDGRIVDMQEGEDAPSE